MPNKIVIGITNLSIVLSPAVAAQVQPAFTASDTTADALSDVSDIGFKTWLLGLAAVIALFLAAEFAFNEQPVSP